MAHIIISGNEKGGSGKTTSAIHLIISLLKLGFKVASVDLDYRQQSLTTYINNRKKSITSEGINLTLPEHYVLEKSKKQNLQQAELEEGTNFSELISKIQNQNDFIIIDTPGSDTFLSRLAHSYSDTVMTPINDSFIDVDLLGKIEVNDLEKIKPGIYSAMVWEQKLKKAARENKQMDWIIMRNRSSSTDNINKRNIEKAIDKLSKKFGFRIVPGFSERVIFRELFLHGLTLNDAGSTNKVRFSTSIVAARQELRAFIKALGLPNVNLDSKL
ncbi:MAG: division plane positioning ATPase MipZ [Candidatus Midichloria sp.]|uniref:Chromosome partitioning protein n=1 Tax=Hyalomma marginatum TaxID=34627 RepID=A0A8S4C1V7_9ACAR|nr:chromosome partitioning protein [Hyalomma marginatum]CAG7592490.1 chromosome partitioning protein [Hyalomma marginatum]